MANGNGADQSIVWDDVRVLTVNHHRQEVFLSQNIGSSPGELRIREPHSVIRADMRDPFRVLDPDVVEVFEQIGVKDFLERILSLTTEQMRRTRFDGISFFEFTLNEATMHLLDDMPDEDELEAEEESEPEPEATATPATRRKRGRPAAE